MVRKLALISLVILMLSASLFASNEYGSRPPFAIGFDARMLGMGGASVGHINTASSIYWNPAGLAFVKRPELQLSHMNLFMDTRYECAAFAYPTLSAGVFGASVSDISSGEFDRISNYTKIGTFSTRQDLFLLGYGFSPLRNFAAGISIKGVYYDLAGYKDSGFGFDAGLIYNLSIIDGLSAGIKASDIYSPRIKLHTTEQSYPLSVKSGLAYKRIIGGSNSLMLSADFEKIKDAGTDIYAGGEFGYNNMIFARLGYMRDELTLGIGISVYDFKFDYAYTSFSELDVSHRLSLSYAFGTSVDEKNARNDDIFAQEKISEYKEHELLESQEMLNQELAAAHEHENAGDIYQAIETYYRVLAIDEQNEDARSKVVLLFDRIKQDIARQASSGYIDELINSQLEVGNRYYDKKQYNEADEQYRLALILAPDNQHAKDRIAAIEKIENSRIERLRTQINQLIKDGDYDQALSNINQILQAKPGDRNALAKKTEINRKFEASRYLETALNYFDRADYEMANVMVDSVIAFNPQSEGGKSLKRQLTRYTAETSTLEDIKKTPAHWDTYIQGMELYQAGSYDEALAKWRSLLEHYPNNPNLRRNIDQAVERTGKK
ncbi:MAG: PorV/PorQ family protein [candidate division Zixibacteria bacterium]|nr:PorV/PorQ family protein [candidate division Zixibacteria bacterium]